MSISMPTVSCCGKLFVFDILIERQLLYCWCCPVFAATSSDVPGTVCVCIFTYGQHFQQSMDHPGMLANPFRGQLVSYSVWCCSHAVRKKKFRVNVSCLRGAYGLICKHRVVYNINSNEWWRWWVS